MSPERQGTWDGKTRSGRNPAKGTGDVELPKLGGEGASQLNTSPEPPRHNQKMTLNPGSDSSPHLRNRLARKTFSVLNQKNIYILLPVKPTLVIVSMINRLPREVKGKIALVHPFSLSEERMNTEQCDKILSKR